MFESLLKKESLVEQVTQQVMAQLKNVNVQEIAPKIQDVKDTLAHKVEDGLRSDAQVWNLPSSLTIIALMSTLGFINHVFNNKGFFKNARTQHIIYGATVCVVAALSFLHHLHHTHLQQICGTLFTIVYGLLNISSVFSRDDLRRVFNQLRGVKMDTIVKDVKQSAQNMKRQVKEKVSEIEEEYKDDTLFSQKSQQQQPHQRQQQHQQQEQHRQQQQQQHHADSSTQERSGKTARKALFWLKQFIFTCITVLPVVLCNTSYISRDMPYTTEPRSWLNPMRFFDAFRTLTQTAHKYPVYDAYHTLSIVNMVGIVFCCAMFMLKNPKTTFSKKLQTRIDKVIPGFSSQYFSYLAYGIGICLTTWRFFSMKQWISCITPVTMAIIWGLDLINNHSAAVQHWLTTNKYTTGLPSITNKINAAMADQKNSSTLKDAVHYSKLMMPFVCRA